MKASRAASQSDARHARLSPMQNEPVTLGQTIPWSQIPDGCFFLHKCGTYELRLDDRVFIIGRPEPQFMKDFGKGVGHAYVSDDDEPPVEVVALGLTTTTSVAAMHDLATTWSRLNTVMEERLRR